MPDRHKRFYYSPKDVQTGSGAHPAYSLIVNGDSLDYKGPCVKLTVHIHVVSSLRDATAVLLLPSDNFMAWTGANLTLSFKRRIGGCVQRSSGSG
jgi:hypothetical protein